MGVGSDIAGDTVSQQTPRSSGSYDLATPSTAMFYEPRMWEYFVFIDTELHKSAS